MRRSHSGPSRGAAVLRQRHQVSTGWNAVTEIYPQIPSASILITATGPDTCITAIQAGSLPDDGSARLKATAKPADWDYKSASQKPSLDNGPSRRIREGERGVLGFALRPDGRQGGWPRRGRHALPLPICSSNPYEALKFRQGTKVDAQAIAMGTSHAPTNSLHPQAGRRHSGHERDRGNPPQAANMLW